MLCIYFCRTTGQGRGRIKQHGYQPYVDVVLTDRTVTCNVANIWINDIYFTDCSKSYICWAWGLKKGKIIIRILLTDFNRIQNSISISPGSSARQANSLSPSYILINLLLYVTWSTTASNWRTQTQGGFCSSHIMGILKIHTHTK